MENDNKLRQELIHYVERPHTHALFADVVKDFPEKLMNEKPLNIPYSFWQMLEHIRISQWDMIDFIRNPGYKEMDWPKDYWPDESQKANAKMWNDSVKKFEKDLADLKKIIEDPKTDLFAPIPHGTGQTIFRETIQIIDHASYHMGQLIVMRRLVGEWK